MKARILTMPSLPAAASRNRERRSDPRYLEGQRILVEAIRYLVQTDVDENLAAIELLSDHFRNKFRMSDKPLLMRPQA